MRFSEKMWKVNYSAYRGGDTASSSVHEYLSSPRHKYRTYCVRACVCVCGVLLYIV